MKPSALAVLGFSLLCANAYAADTTATPSTPTPGAQMQAPAANTQLSDEAFLAANKQQPGVVTLPSGLQYKVVIEGTGKQPKDTDTVTVDYAGTLVDGTEFDSSYKRGQPASFPVNGVIPGWTEALKLMKAGSTWKLYIPANLAYGAQGAPPVIGPNKTLVFKVHLISIQ